jgi:hypothetical protein
MPISINLHIHSDTEISEPKMFKKCPDHISFATVDFDVVTIFIETIPEVRHAAGMLLRACDELEKARGEEE